MRHVEANWRIAVERPQSRLACHVVRELNRGGRPLQVLAEKRTKNSPGRDEPAAFSRGQETRRARALIVGQDGLQMMGPNVRTGEKGAPDVNVVVVEVEPGRASGPFRWSAHSIAAPQRERREHMFHRT